MSLPQSNRWNISATFSCLLCYPSPPLGSLGPLLSISWTPVPAPATAPAKTRPEWSQKTLKTVHGVGSEPEVSHCKPYLCLLFHGVHHAFLNHKKSAFLNHRFLLAAILQLIFSSKPLCLMLFCFSQLHMPICQPSLSFVILLVQMQQQSIIIFCLLKFIFTELKMRLPSPRRQMHC